MIPGTSSEVERPCMSGGEKQKITLLTAITCASHCALHQTSAVFEGKYALLTTNTIDLSTGSHRNVLKIIDLLLVVRTLVDFSALQSCMPYLG